MEQDLNQRLELAIKNKIQDKSNYVCRDKQISEVKDIRINLTEQYATHIVDRVKFNGNAEFGFFVQTGDLSDTLYCHLDFSGYATIKNFEVVEVDVPISINK